MQKKYLLGFVLTALVTGLGWAQQQTASPWWYTLEQGKFLYRSGSYGDAFLAFEDARRGRTAQFAKMEDDMILLLSKADVRPLGNSLEFVEQYITQNNENAAASALAALYYRVPKESLDGSVRRVLEELDRLKSYPEAEFWLGEVYRAEGELQLALRQYRRAWDLRYLLENPELEIDLLYKITDIHRKRQEYQEMERRANEILEGRSLSGVIRDSLWVRDSASTANSRNQIRAAMARVLENEGIDRFLTLYRHNNIATEKAHRLLGFYYYASNRYSLAVEHLMFAFLIQNSVLIDEIIARQFDFTYSNLDSLMALVRTRPEFADFLEETEYFRTAYYLASALFATGKNVPSSQLWAFLAGSGNIGEWGNRARRNPSPFIDRAIEMP